MTQPRQLLDADHLLSAQPARVAGEPRSRRLELPAERTSVRAARRFLAQCLDAWSVPEPRHDDAVLLVSELVTNATVHTTSTRVVCDVALSTEGDLRIEVHDDGHDTRFGAPDAPAVCAEGGRGLHIVRALAETWGIGPSGVTRGKNVWATLSAS